ncbi:MAG TPA: SEC-C metal-binding domain-containing protein [Verrucomicrobiae bacterium]|jgi:hypothetical protein
MPPELLPYLEQTNFYQASLRRLGERLPAEDAGLCQWIEQTIRANEPAALMCLLLAALDAGRKVDAKHLAEGARLLPAPELLLNLALRMEGNVAAHLMTAVQKTVMPLRMTAVALLTIATWCQEHQRELPSGFRAEARLLVRLKSEESKEWLHLVFLHGIAALTNDEDLEKVLYTVRSDDASEAKRQAVRDSSRKAAESWLKVARLEVMTEVPVEQKPPSRILATGTTMRRAVERIGRNEPCPCGSGKKYKRCCFEQDQQRLHESSHVAGKTKRELDAAPEPYLTLEDIKGTHTYTIAKWDPLKIKPELRIEYLKHLAGYKLWDRVVEVYTILGFTPEIEEAWKMALDYAAASDRRDVIEKLVALRRQAQPQGEFEIGLQPRLILAGDNATEKLRLLNEAALAILKSEDPKAMEEFASYMLGEQTRPLGVFIVRSMIPIVPREKASDMFDYLMRARDALQLPPDDPFSDIIDKRLLKPAAGHESDGKDDGALRKAERNLERKGEEVRHLKESVARMQRELTLREKKAARETPSTQPTPITAEESRVLGGLRQKLDEMKETLKERHDERNELRRELQDTQTELEKLRQQQAQPEPASEEDNEDSFLLPGEHTSNHTVRLVEFPKKFDEVLSRLPLHVARAAMTALGRLAAGEPAAFVGAVRLKACPDITRQRIGGDYRLLFRLQPSRLEVVTLINRRDLERTIKTLI